jgi:hypothetical protein
VVRSERLRELERAVSADPQDLVALRELADDRKRRGLELLPDVLRVDPIYLFRWAHRIAALRDRYRAEVALGFVPSEPGYIAVRIGWSYAYAHLPSTESEWTRLELQLDHSFLEPWVITARAQPTPLPWAPRSEETPRERARRKTHENVRRRPPRRIPP